MLPAAYSTPVVSPQSSPRRPLAEALENENSPPPLPRSPAPTPTLAGGVFLLDVVAELRRENERLAADLGAQRDHSESLVRALSARRTRAGPSPGVQRKVMTELVRLRKEVSLSSKSLALLHHETKMTRTAFRVRLETLVTERDALLRAQVRLADDSTRLAIEVASLKRQMEAQAPVQASLSRGATVMSYEKEVEAEVRFGASSPATTPATSLRRRIGAAAAATPSMRVFDPDGWEREGSARVLTTTPATAAQQRSLAAAASEPSTAGRALRARNSELPYAEASLRAKMRQGGGEGGPAVGVGGSAWTPRLPSPSPGAGALLRRVAAAAAQLADRVRESLSPPFPAVADSGDAGLTEVPPAAGFSADSDADAREELPSQPLAAAMAAAKRDLCGAFGYEEELAPAVALAPGAAFSAPHDVTPPSPPPYSPPPPSPPDQDWALPPLSSSSEDEKKSLSVTRPFRRRSSSVRHITNLQTAAAAEAPDEEWPLPPLSSSSEDEKPLQRPIRRRSSSACDLTYLPPPPPAVPSARSSAPSAAVQRSRRASLNVDKAVAVNSKEPSLVTNRRRSTSAPPASTANAQRPRRVSLDKAMTVNYKEPSLSTKMRAPSLWR